MSDIETNAARRSSGLRAIADGLEINPDLSVAQKVICDAAIKIEELECERDEAHERECAAIESWWEEHQRALREGQRVVELREQNAKLREIAKRAIKLLTTPPALFVFPTLEIHNEEHGKQLRAALDQLTEGGE